MIGALAFTTPALLWALVALPVLWWLLRAIPPAPVRRRFPGVALLIGLKDDSAEAQRTPWWLLALRMAALAVVIVGLAGPVLAPEARAPGAGPLMVVLDGGWADARDWTARIAQTEAALDRAAGDGRPVQVVLLSAPPAAGAGFVTAADARTRLTGLAPQPWLPGAAAVDWAEGLDPTLRFDTIWLTGGLDWPGRASVLAALRGRGAVRVIDSTTPLLALAPPRFDDGIVTLGLQARPAGLDLAPEVVARGPDPAGTQRDLARLTLPLPAGAAAAEAVLDTPPEVRNRLERLQITGQAHAGAVALIDDSLRRRKVVLIAGREGGDEALQLLSPLHYLREALKPSADLIEGAGLAQALLASPDVVILADVARLPPAETEALTTWVRDGGLLVRFAGPRLAASDLARAEEDPLLPVRLREGGRALGGAMSWGAPRRLATFPDTSPFAGLPLPGDVEIRAQVLAQPDPELGLRSIASLEDGTPLVTRRALGAGAAVLFHVTANAEWSSLPLSGLFVQMLERLAISARTALPPPDEMAGQTWTALRVLDGFGRLTDAGRMAGVEGAALARALADGAPGPGLPPGLYVSGDRRVALNALGPETVLAAATWPADVPVEGMARPSERDLKGPALGLGLILLLADWLATLALGGRLVLGLRRALPVFALALLMALPGTARAADPAADPAADGFAAAATADLTLAHILTGDPRTDRVAKAGLKGLGQALAARSSIEPGPPMGVDLERDELAFFPLLYWPVGPDTPLPSAEAYGKLARYLRSGGMVVFDTRDGDQQAGGIATPAQARLRAIAAPLDIPPLEPLPMDHVLTRTFYLLADFPGRIRGAPPWVEVSSPAADAEGMPFRILNDGVTPVLIGANDWIGAWAVEDSGAPMLPVGRGYAGERQREMAYRFGINLVMHVLTGNYKSDQVHVPALLDRLGQ